MHLTGRRVTLIIMISLIWSLTTVSGQIPTGSQANGKISGKVLGADSKPVAGASLSLRASGSSAAQASSATTDESGTFAFSTLGSGDYFLSAAKGAYVYQGFTSKDQANPTETAF